MRYQGVAIRLAALLIDGIILGIITSAISLGAGYYAASGNVTVSVLGIMLGNATASVLGIMLGPIYLFDSFAYGSVWDAAIVLGIVIELLYFTLLLGRYGQSVGMMAVKIKVVNEADSAPITYGAAFIRTILLYVDEIPYAIPFLLGAILIWTSDKKQRLGDRVAHTVVLKA
jgi:uncharacterized RDD family membrane protein YckC